MLRVRILRGGAKYLPAVIMNNHGFVPCKELIGGDLMPVMH